MYRPRDNQRSRVYKWERASVDGFWHETGLADCREVSRQVCDDLGFPDVQITDGRGRRSACAWPTFSKICLPWKFRTRPIVLHELAHVFLDKTYGSDKYAAHGPEFVRVFMWLLGQYHGMSMRRLQNDAAACGVRYASPKILETLQAKPLIYSITHSLAGLRVDQLRRIQRIVEE